LHVSHAWRQYQLSYCSYHFYFAVVLWTENEFNLTRVSSEKKNIMAAIDAVAITCVPAYRGSVIPGNSKAPQAFQDVGIASKLRDAAITSVSENHALDAPATYTTAHFEPGSVRNEASNISVCRRVKEYNL
jgi:hypothetical protein